MITKDSIRELLLKSDAAVERGILAIYDRQTQDEKVSETTNHQNGVGFSGADAQILSSFAEQIEKKLQRGIKAGQCLSVKQMELARKKIVRYSRQLLEIAEAKSCSPNDVSQACETFDEEAQKEESRSTYEIITNYLRENGEKELSLYSEEEKRWNHFSSIKAYDFLSAILPSITGFVVSEDGPVLLTLTAKGVEYPLHMTTF
jgi:hypothetical protein